jgi:nucleotide-binding universal stress UspA family protein
MFKKILVGYDDSKSARLALERATTLAKESGAELSAIWVREPLPRHSDLPGEFEEESEAAAEYFKARQQEINEFSAKQKVKIKCESRSGHPAKTIIGFADENGFDLIVIGHSDHSGLWGRLLGDTADRTSDHAHCSVLIVKQ